MTLETVPAAEQAPETRPGYPPTESRPRWIALGHSPQRPTRLTACSRPTPLPRSSAAPPQHRNGSDFPPHVSGLVCVPGIRRPAGRFTAHACECI